MFCAKCAMHYPSTAVACSNCGGVLANSSGQVMVGASSPHSLPTALVLGAGALLFAAIAVLGVLVWKSTSTSVTPVAQPGPAVVASAPPTTETTKTVSVQPTVVQPTVVQPTVYVTPQERDVNRGRYCAGPDGTGYSVSVGSSSTSCEYAINARRDYFAGGASAGGTRYISPWSPARGEFIGLVCRGSQPVTCTGGVNAVVYFN